MLYYKLIYYYMTIWKIKERENMVQVIFTYVVNSIIVFVFPYFRGYSSICVSFFLEFGN